MATNYFKIGLRLKSHFTFVLLLSFTTNICLFSSARASDSNDSAGQIIAEVKTAAKRGAGVSLPAEKIYFEAHGLRVSSGVRFLLNDEKFLRAFPEYYALRSKIDVLVRLAVDHDYHKVNLTPDNPVPQKLAQSFGRSAERLDPHEAQLIMANVDDLNARDKAHMAKLYANAKLSNQEIKSFENLESVVDLHDRYYTSQLGEAYDYGKKLKPTSTFFLEGSGWRSAEATDITKIRMAQYLETPGNFPFNKITQGYRFEPYVARKLSLNKSFEDFKAEQVRLARISPVSAMELKKIRLAAKITRPLIHVSQAAEQRNLFRVGKNLAKTSLRVAGKALPLIAITDTTYSAMTSESPNDFMDKAGYVPKLAAATPSDYYLGHLDDFFALPLEDQAQLRLQNEALDNAAHSQSPFLIGLRCESDKISVQVRFNKKAGFGQDTTQLMLTKKASQIQQLNWLGPTGESKFSLPLDQHELPYASEAQMRHSPERIAMIRLALAQTENIKNCCVSANTTCPQSVAREGRKYAREVELQRLNSGDYDQPITKAK